MGFYFEICAQPQSSWTASLWIWLFEEQLILPTHTFLCTFTSRQAGIFLLLPIIHECNQNHLLIKESQTIKINIEAFSSEECMVLCSQKHFSINHTLCKEKRWYVFHTSVLKDKSGRWYYISDNVVSLGLRGCLTVVNNFSDDHMQA